MQARGWGEYGARESTGGACGRRAPGLRWEMPADARRAPPAHLFLRRAGALRVRSTAAESASPSPSSTCACSKRTGAGVVSETRRTAPTTRQPLARFAVVPLWAREQEVAQPSEGVVSGSSPNQMLASFLDALTAARRRAAPRRRGAVCGARLQRVAPDSRTCSRLRACGPDSARHPPHSPPPPPP